MSKTIKEISAEIEGMKTSITGVVNYFMRNNPTVIPNVKVETWITHQRISNGRTMQSGKGVDVNITIEFLKENK